MLHVEFTALHFTGLPNDVGFTGGAVLQADVPLDGFTAPCTRRAGGTSACASDAAEAKPRS